jgi:hypothetical protein
MIGLTSVGNNFDRPKKNNLNVPRNQFRQTNPFSGGYQKIEKAYEYPPVLTNSVDLSLF